MAINDFIISTLNVSDDMIFSIDTHKSSDKLHILIKLNDTHPTCPYCGGHTKIKDYSSYSYNHLDVAGIPSIIDWTRRRYVCKECGKSFSEPSPYRRQSITLTYGQLINVIPSITCTQKDDYIKIPILALYSHPISLFKTHYLFYLNKVMHIMSHLFRLLFSQTLYYVIFL